MDDRFRSFGARGKAKTQRRWCVRLACRRAFRTGFADDVRHAALPGGRVDRSARRRGCSPPHAIRILARARIRFLRRARHDGRSDDRAGIRPAIGSPEPIGVDTGCLGPGAGAGQPGRRGRSPARGSNRTLPLAASAAASLAPTAAGGAMRRTPASYSSAMP